MYMKKITKKYYQILYFLTINKAEKAESWYYLRLIFKSNMMENLAWN